MNGDLTCRVDQRTERLPVRPFPEVLLQARTEIPLVWPRPEGEVDSVEEGKRFTSAVVLETQHNRRGEDVHRAHRTSCPFFGMTTGSTLDTPRSRSSETAF